MCGACGACGRWGVERNGVAWWKFNAKGFCGNTVRKGWYLEHCGFSITFQVGRVSEIGLACDIQHDARSIRVLNSLALLKLLLCCQQQFRLFLFVFCVCKLFSKRF